MREKLISANSAEEIASLLEEFDIKALKIMAGNEYMNINRRLGKKNFIKEMAKILWDRYEQVDAGGIIAVMGFMGLPTVLETSLINGRKEYNAAKAVEAKTETKKLVDYRGLLNFENPSLEDSKKIHEIQDANFDLLDSCTTESEIYAVCMNTTTSFLRYLCSEKFANFDKNARYTHEELAKFFASNEIASREYRTQATKVETETEEEESEMTKTAETEAEPTLEELEQETGFTYCRRLGQEFLSGEVSLGQLTNQIESLKRSFKYGDNSGTLHGLAYAFGITLEGKSCEELLSEIQGFIKNKTFEQLTPAEKINALTNGDYDFSSMTRLIWESERYEMARLLGLDTQAIYRERHEQGYHTSDKDYLEVVIKRTILSMRQDGERITASGEIITKQPVSNGEKIQIKNCRTLKKFLYEAKTPSQVEEIFAQTALRAIRDYALNFLTREQKKSFEGQKNNRQELVRVILEEMQTCGFFEEQPVSTNEIEAEAIEVTPKTITPEYEAATRNFEAYKKIYNRHSEQVREKRFELLGVSLLMRETDKAVKYQDGIKRVLETLREEYKKLRLIGLDLRKKLRKAQSEVLKFSQAVPISESRADLFSLNDDSCLTADYKGYQRVLAHDKAVIEQCQTPDEIQAKLLTVDKGSIVGIAHACGMTEQIRDYKKIAQSELAKICAEKIFEARTISYAI